VSERSYYTAHRGQTMSSSAVSPTPCSRLWTYTLRLVS